jgi:hypothetical protein
VKRALDRPQAAGRYTAGAAGIFGGHSDEEVVDVVPR